MDVIQSFINNHNDIIKDVHSITPSKLGSFGCYILDGSIHYNDHHYNKGVIKQCSESEIKFYSSDICTTDISVQPYIICKESNTVLLEYVDTNVIGNIDYFNKMWETLNIVHSKPYSRWIPTFTTSSHSPESYILNIGNIPELNDIHQYISSIIRILESVQPYLKHINNLPKAVCHGDVHPTNSGYRNDRIILYDWATIKFMPIELELCYPVEFLSVYTPSIKEQIDSIYQAYMNVSGRRIDTELCHIGYIYMCLYNYIPIYMTNPNSNIRILRQCILNLINMSRIL